MSRYFTPHESGAMHVKSEILLAFYCDNCAKVVFVEYGMM
jgi:hypothetical protein